MPAATPTQASLDRALARATSVRITGVPQLGGEVLLVVDEVGAVRELARLLAIVPAAAPFRCMCMGDQVLEFRVPWRRNVVITLHHGQSVRWQRWSSDALLANGEALLRRLAAHGLTGPLEAWQEARRQAASGRLAWDAWLTAAPTALLPFLNDPQLSSINPEYPPEALMRGEAAHRAACPDAGAAILALVDWFGSGGGPWSGFASYQSVPEALLLRYPTDAVVAALAREPLTTTRAEGAARLFASWWFGRLRPGEASSLPEALRVALVEHVTAVGDADKRERLAHALAARP